MTVFYMGNRWPLKSVFKLLGNSNFVFLMKERVTPKKINLPKCFWGILSGHVPGAL